MQKKVLFLLLILLANACPSIAQKIDITKSITYFSGSINVTNNGISLVPNFSLGKPAVIVNLSAGKSRLTFDPDIRFSLSAKPWTMLFWLRYKFVPTGKFRLTAGSHLGLNFKINSLPINGNTVETNIVRRYFATELAPSYFITKNIKSGLYYLYSYGLDAGTVNNTHFLVFNTIFSNIKITKEFFIRFTPQIYYLKQDARRGTYFTSSLNIAKKNFPFSASAFINQKLSGDIVGSEKFIWSASLIYSFNKTYFLRTLAL